MRACRKTRRTAPVRVLPASAPKRPRGKNASAEAGELGEDAEEAEAAARTRREEPRDDQWPER